ncbi:hypothetical protein BY996DRAFT_7507201 [Phakopsora pachyrhizi]|nr:hypothetical protein BY996DRAFT_7507201 [Phakopsora pachyrhizi]
MTPPCHPSHSSQLTDQTPSRSSTHGGHLNRQRKLFSGMKRRLEIPGQTIPDRVLKLARRWILTFGLINFDLDEGPDFDNCYPEASFSSNQMSNIAFSSFPDCARTGCLMFSWRIPVTGRDQSRCNEDLRQACDHQSNNLTDQSPSDSLMVTTSLDENDGCVRPGGDLFGYVYFVQEKDETYLRGYNQRSIVLITHLSDYAGLFSTLVNRLGPLYATQGSSILEAAIHNMSSWPDPVAGTSPELAFLGQVHTFVIPLEHQPQLLEPRSQSRSTLHGEILSSTPPTYLSSILFGRSNNSPSLLSSGPTPSVNSYSSNTQIGLSSNGFLINQFQQQQQQQQQQSNSIIWLLWEILVLGEPLIVFGNSPDLVSETIIHLKNLIKPIPFRGDWRPYITIHDPDFQNLFSKNKARGAVLIGVTNPIIVSNNQNSWPHILCIKNNNNSSNNLGSNLSKHLNGIAGGNFGGTGLGGGGGGIGIGSGSAQFGLITDRKRHLHKDKNFVKQLEACLERQDYHQADVVISRHFSLLTEQFLQPLQRYFTTLLPVEHSLSKPQRPGSFNEEVFLKSLREHTTALEFRSPRFLMTTGLSIINGFYVKFLRSINFSGWLHHQVDQAQSSGRVRYLNRLESPFELEKWVNSDGIKSKDEIDELLSRIEIELKLQSGSSSQSVESNHLSSSSQMNKVEPEGQGVKQDETFNHQQHQQKKIDHRQNRRRLESVDLTSPSFIGQSMNETSLTGFFSSFNKSSSSSSSQPPPTSTTSNNRSSLSRLFNENGKFFNYQSSTPTRITNGLFRRSRDDVDLNGSWTMIDEGTRESERIYNSQLDEFDERGRVRSIRLGKIKDDDDDDKDKGGRSSYLGNDDLRRSSSSSDKSRTGEMIVSDRSERLRAQVERLKLLLLISSNHN